MKGLLYLVKQLHCFIIIIIIIIINTVTCIPSLTSL